MTKNYKIKYTPSSQSDVKRMRKYILHIFKYLELAKNFDNKISNALKMIKTAPHIYQPTKFYYKEYEIYMRCIDSFLFFYIIESSTIILLRVLKDGMNWEYIIKLWLSNNNH